MIRPPRRAVTRFLIPLLDVLILLFCMFLLMPFVSAPATSEEPDTEGPSAAELKDEVVDLKAKLAQAEEAIKRLKKAATDPGDRLIVKPLEIDATTGRLYAFDPDPAAVDSRQEIRDQSDAQRIINTHTRLAGGKDVFFLILYPRQRSGFPELPQVQQYRRWFAGVPHGFDNPWGEARE